MCNVPPKFYQVCRLCLSSSPTSNHQQQNNKNCDNLKIINNDNNKNDKIHIFDETNKSRNISFKIMTCLSILVS